MILRNMAQLLCIAAAASAAPAAAGMEPANVERPAYGPMLEGFAYPHAVQRFDFTSQGQRLSMAYMDVAPARPNGRTAVLLHGKNFCAATWESAIAALSKAGYRVVAPDQVGFCKSSKPQAYQFSFGQLARNTSALLQSIGVDEAVIVGHSMGGMLATRYALHYPAATERLVLVNPIGLEDWQAMGVPWRSVDDWHARELKTSFDSIKRYQQDVYYDGRWEPRYERWVEMLGGVYAGDGGGAVAWNQALTSDMVFTQPVVHELPQIQVPTALIIGQRDRTAIGKDLAAPELAQRLGDYPALGKRAAAAIRGSVLVEFDGLGHSPQVEDPQRFNAVLLELLRGGAGDADPAP